jgi:hypothetical protein
MGWGWGDIGNMGSDYQPSGSCGKEFGLMAIQKNTAISETVVRASGYQFRVLNECNAPEDIQGFERPGMLSIRLWGIRFGSEHNMSFVNDLEDPTSAPLFW